MGGFSSPHSPIYRSSYPEKINTKRYHLNGIRGQMDEIDICKALHPNTAECTMFSAVPGTFSKRNHVIGHKESPNSCRKTEVIFGILANHNG